MDQRPKYKSQYPKTFIRNLHKIEFGNTPKAQVTKEKNRYIGLHQNKKCLCIIGHNEWSEKATYEMGDIIYKSYI